MIDISKKQRLLVALTVLYDECPTGGALHIVTDDLNTEDGSIEWCKTWLDESKAGESERRLVMECTEALIPLTPDEREDILREFHGC